MQQVTPMIGRRGKKFYMREAYCHWCKSYKKVVELRWTDVHRCPICKKGKLSFRFKYIGNKIDVEDYMNTPSKKLKRL